MKIRNQIIVPYAMTHGRQKSWRRVAGLVAPVVERSDESHSCKD